MSVLSPLCAAWMHGKVNQSNRISRRHTYTCVTGHSMTRLKSSGCMVTKRENTQIMLLTMDLYMYSGINDVQVAKVLSFG